MAGKLAKLRLVSKPGTESVPTAGGVTRILAVAAEFQTVAVGGLFVLAFLAALSAARSVLLPAVLAGFLTVPLMPLVRFLRRLHVPRLLASALVVSGLVAALGFGATQVARPAAKWIENAPRNLREAKTKIENFLHRTLHWQQALTALPPAQTNALQPPRAAVSPAAATPEPQAAAPAAAPAAPPAQPPDTLTAQRLGEFVVHWTRSVIGELAVLVLLLFFFLGSDGRLTRKLMELLPRLGQRRRAVKLTAALQATLSHYLLTVLAINATLGGATALVMYFLHMPSPAVWGVMAALMPFVPYFGALAGVTVLTAVSFTVFQSIGHALVPPLAYFGLACLEGGFVTPLILGQQLALNPVVIVLSVIFWGWLWGILGAVLAVPILIVIKVVCEHIEPLHGVSEFITTDGARTNSRAPHRPRAARAAAVMVFALLTALPTGNAAVNFTSRGPNTTAPTTGYALLYELAKEESGVDKILIIKPKTPVLTDLLPAIAAAFRAAKTSLEKFAAADSTIDLENTGLPPAEQETRASIRAATSRQLLFANAKAFPALLIATQLESTCYATHLCRILAADDKNKARQAELHLLANEFQELNDKLAAHLAVR